MCGPAIGIITGLASSAVSAAGAMAQANAQANNAEYNAKVEKINARSRRQEGLQESERIADKYNRVQGENTNAFAGAGVDPFFGSSLSIFADTERARGADMDTNYINAESRAVGHENKAKQFEYEADSQRKAGRMQAFGTLLGGLGSAAKGFGSAMKIA